MVFALLTRHWLARRHYPFASWAACIVRSLRVLLFRRAHVELLAMDVYRNYVTPVHDDVFHHLSHRNYLARGLSLRQRVRCTLTHSRFEDVTFDAAYKQAVYRDGGRRSDADADGERPAPAPPVVQLGRRTFRRPGRTRRGRHPAVHRPQPGAPRRRGGRRRHVPARFSANSPLVSTPGVFCCAALQGIAQALGMDHPVAVKSAWHCAYAPSDDKQFAIAYDDFWRSLGGTEMPGRAWHIALPFEAKPLAEIPSKRRKRAALRREYWRTIGEAAAMTLRVHTVTCLKTTV